MPKLMWAALATILFACSANGEADPPPPSFTLEEHVDWYVDVLNTDGVGLEESEFLERFDATFATQVPFDEFVAINHEISRDGPFEIIRVDDPSTGERVAHLGGPETELIASFAVGADGRLVGLYVQPAATTDPLTASSPSAAMDEIDSLGELWWLHAHVDGAASPACTVVDGYRADELAPIASGFKLYVLAAVADAITTEELSWESELVITPAVKSLPGGELHHRLDGSTVTVREAAQLMIEISDNTAADLLINVVGRELVEQAVADWGHSDPEAMQPFLTTQEMFLLKLSEPSIAHEYADADMLERRELLTELLGRSLDGLPLSTLLIEPILPDRVEWFASPLDMCEVMARLMYAGETDPLLAPLTEILSTNPGFPSDEWNQIAFKGGSETGLVHVTWVMDDAEGNRSAFVASLVNPDEAFDPIAPLSAFSAARDAAAASD